MVLDADYTKNLPLEEVTIAEALKPFGYTSAAIGKWHVSWDEGYYPEQQGFDFNIGETKWVIPVTISVPTMESGG